MDLAAKRAAMRVLTYGVYIATAKSGESISAAIVTWVSQASIEPPLIMMGIKKDGRIFNDVKTSQKFVLNIVGEDQKKFAASFMKKCEVDGNKINGLSLYRRKIRRTGVYRGSLLFGVPGKTMDRRW